MSINISIYNKIIDIVTANNVKTDEPLKDHTYAKIGGKADYFITPKNYEEISKLVKLCNEDNIPYTIIGNGSNLIIRDGGIRGIVLSFNKLNNIYFNNTSLTAQSGASIISVSEKALFHELTGLEFACGIPGTVGGAVFMNAGAYGGEIKDVIDYCLVVDRDGYIVRRNSVDLEMDYRYSNISKNQDIILEATFKLKSGEYEKIKSLMDDLTIRRQLKQPLEYPSCGSVFKRPPGCYAGKLIEESNLQGIRMGGAEVSKKHAGFIVNINNATATEYINLIEFVQKTVKEKFNVNLEREVKIIGEDSI